MIVKSNARKLSRSRGLVISGIVLLMPLMLLGIFDPSFFLISMAAGLLSIMIMPFFYSRQIEWFSPWSWLFYFTIIGVFLRSIYITFDIPDALTVNSVLLLNEPKEFLFWPMVVVSLGLCFTTFGYLVGPVIPRKIPMRFFRSDRWDKNRLSFALSILLAFAWIGFYYFVDKTSGGSLTVENLSSHRGISKYLDEYAANGYLWWLVNCSDLVLYLVLANVISNRHTLFRDLVVLSLSLGTSLLFYFYTQNRSGIIVMALNVLSIMYYSYGKKFPVKIAVVAAPIVLFIFLLMTSLRPGSGYSGNDPLDIAVTRAIQPLVLTQNGIDVSKTGHIMAAIGKQLDYQWGSTLLDIFTIWIPRQLWPAKPPNVDTILGMAVFGAQTFGSGGVAPGLVAEMYWNFWIPGVIGGCFLVGFLLRIIHTQFSAYSSNRNIVLLYVTAFMQLGVALIGSGFSSSFVSFLMTAMPLSIILHFITNQERPAALEISGPSQRTFPFRGR